MSPDRIPGAAGQAGPAPAGWRILVPGLPHWFWERRGQAWVLGGSHAAATAIGLFLWGTWPSLLMLAFAYVAHAISAAAAIERAAFPKFGPWAPLLAASVGLGAIFYAPLLVLGSTFAWPVVAEHPPREGYWVNRWAYRGRLAPQHGETVWLRAVERARPRLARVLAHGGQKVRWAANRLHIDDSPAHPSTAAPNPFSHEVELTVPERHVLVSFHAPPDAEPGDRPAWEIVARDEIDGRAWAQSYPVWRRRLLR